MPANGRPPRPATAARKDHVLRKQLFDSTTSTYSYLVADPNSAEAVLIDPVREQVQRDLQLIKRPLFRTIDLAELSLAVLGRTLEEVSFEEENTKGAMDQDLYATERAYRMVVDEGIPFREAYRRVAEELS